MVTDIKLKDLTSSEKHRMIVEIDGDGAGRGVIRSSEYYTIAYRPDTDTKTYRCNGICIFVKKNKNEGIVIPPEIVRFRQHFLDQKEPFKDRMEYTINRTIARVDAAEADIRNEIWRVAREKEEHEQSIKNHTEKVRACLLKIDDTVKAIAPDSKSMIECAKESHMLEAARAEYDPVDIRTGTFESPMSELIEKAFGEQPMPRESAPLNVGDRQKDPKFSWYYQDVVEDEPSKPWFVSDTEIRVNKSLDGLGSDHIMQPELLSPSDPRYYSRNERHILQR